MCASCLFENHFLAVLFFFFLLAVCTEELHFAAPLQPAVPGAESESPSGCFATGHTLRKYQAQLLQLGKLRCV